MNRMTLARGFSILFLAWLFSLYIDHDILRMSREGRDRYLARQAQRFDRTASTRHPEAVATIGAVLVIVPALLFYELLAFLASQFLKALGIGADGSAPSPAPQLPFS